MLLRIAAGFRARLLIQFDGSPLAVDLHDLQQRIGDPAERDLVVDDFHPVVFHHRGQAVKVMVAEAPTFVSACCSATTKKL